MKIAILGRGVSGRSAEALAVALGYEIYFFEDGTFSGKDSENELRSCRFAVVSPGIPPASPLYRMAVASGIEMISELEFAARHFPGRVLAVTGTNGKTTTTELTVHLLCAIGFEAVSVGNIGNGWSELTAEIIRKERPIPFAVVEVSSFQLELVQDFAPEAAVILNLASDHLDRYHGSMQEYGMVKGRIFAHVPSENRIFGESLLTSPLRKLTGSKAFGNRLVSPDGDTISYGGRAIVRMSETRLRGAHNRENLLAALELIRCACGDDVLFSEKLREAIKSFSPGEHRLETVAERNGVVFINDSKATNPHAVLAALNAVGKEGSVRLLLGGLDKGMDFSELLGGLHFVRKAYLQGQCRDKIHAVIKDACECECFDAFDEAVYTAAREARPGETVLLSPACASMDMFKNYRERGERFRLLVSQPER